jgi:hypothetical protein
MLEVEEFLVLVGAIGRGSRDHNHLRVLLPKLLVPESQLRHMPAAEGSGHTSEEDEENMLASSVLR